MKRVHRKLITAQDWERGWGELVSYAAVSSGGKQEGKVAKEANSQGITTFCSYSTVPPEQESSWQAAGKTA